MAPDKSTILINFDPTAYWTSTEGQETVSDEEIQNYQVSLEEWVDALIVDYRNMLLMDDIAGIMQFNEETIHWHGRFVAHFDEVNGDGWDILDEFRSDLGWVIKLAGNDKIKQFRYTYATYNFYASGKKARRESVIIQSVTGKIPTLIGRIHAFRKFPGLRFGNRNKRPAYFLPPPPEITKWTVVPPGFRGRSAGSITVFSGQSVDTILSFIEKGIIRRPPRHPGRAHYGIGVYTSPQKTIAEKYADDAGGAVLRLDVNVNELTILNLTDPKSKAIFNKYIDDLGGKSIWNRQENRYPVTEGFISVRYPDVDIVVAPHENGTQIVFRSQSALKRLENAVRNFASQNF